MSTRFRGSGWVARLDERLGSGEVGLLVSRAGSSEPPEALRCSIAEDSQSTSDYLATGRAYSLRDGTSTVGRWYSQSQTLVIDLRAFAAARRDRGYNGLSFAEYSGEVTLQGG